MAMLVANRLKTHYRERVIPLMLDEFAYKPGVLIPRIKSIMLMYATSPRGNINVRKDMTILAGQRAIQRKAKISSRVKEIRKGAPTGAIARLTGNRMYSFLDRLITLGFPKTVDFKGLDIDCFEGKGSCKIPLCEKSVFAQLMLYPTTEFTEIDIHIKTSAQNHRETHRLLALMGIPFVLGVRPRALIKKQRFYWQGKVVKPPLIKGESGMVSLPSADPPVIGAGSEGDKKENEVKPK